MATEQRHAVAMVMNRRHLQAHAAAKHHPICRSAMQLRHAISCRQVRNTLIPTSRSPGHSQTLEGWTLSKETIRRCL